MRKGKEMTVLRCYVFSLHGEGTKTVEYGSEIDLPCSKKEYNEFKSTMRYYRHNLMKIGYRTDIMWEIIDDKPYTPRVLNKYERRRSEIVNKSYDKYSRINEFAYRNL